MPSKLQSIEDMRPLRVSFSSSTISNFIFRNHSTVFEKHPVCGYDPGGCEPFWGAKKITANQKKLRFLENDNDDKVKYVVICAAQDEVSDCVKRVTDSERRATWRKI